MIKPGKNDIKVNIKFEQDELYLLQENTQQMAESFGLDSRISRLKGPRPPITNSTPCFFERP